MSQRLGGPEEIVERSFGRGGAVGNRVLKVPDWKVRVLIGEIGDTM